MHCQVARKLLELIRARYEVGLAVDFHQAGNPRAGVDVVADNTFVGFAVGFFGGSGQALLAQQFGGCLKVAI